MDFSKEEPNLPSDSDDSDDDYVPSGAESNPPSEVESDGDDEDAPDSDEDTQSSKKRKKDQKVSKKKSRKKGRKSVDLTEEAPDDADADKPKEKVLTQEEEKKHADSLWADFMKDTNTSSRKTKTDSNEKSEKEDKTINDKVIDEKAEPKKEEKENKVTVTEVFEFAGEEVKITKEVDATSQEARFATKTVVSGSSGPLPTKGRGRAPGGLSSVLGQLGKKSKLGTLEKSKLDWDRFKKNEGIEDELKTFNRGKDGYLEKQDFLQRTDLRQFEIEKGMRATRRSNR